MMEEKVTKYCVAHGIALDAGEIGVFLEKHKDEIEAWWEERTQQRRGRALLGRLQRLADRLTRDAKRAVAGRPVSPQQEERWEQKYAAAKDYLATKDPVIEALFAPEAAANGISVEELTQKIVATGDAWRQRVRDYLLLIDTGRAAIGALVKAGKLEAAARALASLEALGADVTPERLAEIVKKAKRSRK